MGTIRNLFACILILLIVRLCHSRPKERKGDNEKYRDIMIDKYNDEEEEEEYKKEKKDDDDDDADDDDDDDDEKDGDNKKEGNKRNKYKKADVEGLLIRKLLKRHSNSVRPNKTVKVTVSYYLINLYKVSVEDGMCQVLIRRSLDFKDNRLEWVPQKWRATRTLRIRSESIWIPDVVFSNALTQKISPQFPARAIVNYDGSVSLMESFYIGIPLTKINDTVQCYFTYLSWSNNGNEVDISWANPETLLAEYTGNALWDLETAEQDIQTYVYACCPEPYQLGTVTFNITYKSN